MTISQSENVWFLTLATASRSNAGRLWDGMMTDTQGLIQFDIALLRIKANQYDDPGQLIPSWLSANDR